MIHRIDGAVGKVVEIVVVDVVRFGPDVRAPTFLAVITLDLSDFVAGFALGVEYFSAFYR